MSKLIGLAALFLLTGCDSPNYPPRDYLARLENTLSVSEPELPLKIDPFPQPRDLRLNLNAAKISIRDFLSLRECQLHLVLAKRNSLMGKVASQSQRLFNDLDILATGPDCVSKLDNQTLAKQLQRYLHDKESQIGASMWQAILGSSENRSFWHLSANTEALALPVEMNVTRSLAALTRFINLIKQGHYQFTEHDYQEIEQHLGQLRSGQGGLLYHESARLAQTLARADRLIQQRLSRPLCFNQQPTQSARYFQNVVNKVFIANVQALAVDLTRRETQLMKAYRELENSLLEYAPQNYQNWVQNRTKTLNQGRQAAHQHVLLVQQLYQQCGLAAGNRTR